MNRVLLLACIGMAAALSPAHAGSRSSISDRAVVVSVEPMFKSARVRVPSEDCYEAQERASPSYAMTNGVAGAVVGAIAGGVAGHQFGKGRGKDAATAAGALIGAGVGQRVAHQNFPDGGSRTVVRCAKSVHYEHQERLSGYRVRYEYLGHVFETTMKHRPDSTIPVRVTVSPAR